MNLKTYLTLVEKRLDAKCSWGQKEIKMLLRDCAIELYEANDVSTKRKDKENNKPMESSSDVCGTSPVGQTVAKS